MFLDKAFIIYSIENLYILENEERRERDLNPRIRGFADLAIRPLWYRAKDSRYAFYQKYQKVVSQTTWFSELPRSGV